MKCKICNSILNDFGKGKILNKYDVSFYRCNECEFIQTEEPYWLNEAYINPINSTDVGLVRRNLNLSLMTKTILATNFNCNKTFVDVAGGYGLFVRRMRDLGFDFYWADKYCKNLFANGFEYSKDQHKEIEAITAFEVFEHLSDPLKDIKTFLNYSKNILFTTELIPENIPKPGEWWYYGLQHGQHISFFSKKTLSVISKHFGLNFYSNGSFYHVFTEKKLFKPIVKFVLNPKMSKVLSFLFWRKSYLFEDSKKNLKLF